MESNVLAPNEMILGLLKSLVTGESKQNIREGCPFLKSGGCQFREGGDACLSEMGLLLRIKKSLFLFPQEPLLCGYRLFYFILGISC